MKMICYPESHKTTPLIIVGPQRSGTRFITNVLNATPGIIIQSEIPDSVMIRVLELVKKCHVKFGKSDKKYTVKNWDTTSKDFMYSVWSNLTQGKRISVKNNCVFYGYKTPFHEAYFDFYNELFHPVRPKYICCIRSFLDHYFSVQARWPNRNIFRVARRYTRSLRQIRYMKEQRPDDVLVFILDDYKKTGVQYLHQKIFEPLGLENTAPGIKKAQQGPANASAQLGLKKKKTLTRIQSLFLKLYPQPLKEFETLRRDFG